MTELDTKPLKTWSHLSAQKRRPSEYEIVSVGLHFSTSFPECPWELDPDLFMNRWFRQNREGSPLKHDNWNAFRDPDELTYRGYNIAQDAQENYVEGLLAEFDKLEHDQGLRREWVETLREVYTPARYLLHAVQMGSAYLAQIAPASTITNCATFQAADSLRWLSHLAYRTKQLDLAHPGLGIGKSERECWEKAPHWQGFRELAERMLAAYDWGESMVALNLVLKPSLDEALLRQLGHSARRNGDGLLGFLLDAQYTDSERARRWNAALVHHTLARDENLNVLNDWVLKWLPLGDAAIDAYCQRLPDAPAAADDAKRDTWAYRSSLGLAG
jgi:toluene monooxygenase system protein E